MPFVYSQADQLQGKPLAGEGDCVDLIKKYVPGLKLVSTTAWKAGARVMEAPTLERGTAIATFENGRYPSRPNKKHAAFVLRVMPSGIWVVDQWKNDPVQRPEIRSRLIRTPPPRQIKHADGTYIDPSNNAHAYFVIELR